MTLRNIRLVATLAVTVALAACAGGPPKPPPNARPPAPAVSADILFFAAADQNADDIITWPETEMAAKLRFARADTDSSGAISPLEWVPFSEASLGGLNVPPFRLAFDTVFDNEVTQVEFVDWFKARFTKLDGNTDQRLTRSELLADAKVENGLQDEPPGPLRGNRKHRMPSAPA